MHRDTIPLPTLEGETSVSIAVVNRHSDAIPIRLELVTASGCALGCGEKRTIPPSSHLTFEVEMLVRQEELEQELFLEVSHFGQPGHVSAWMVIRRTDASSAPAPSRASAGAVGPSAERPAD